MIQGHTVEKIGGTSISRADELMDTLFCGDREGGPYGRLFVVSAFGGITDLLLESKKSGEPGVYGHFASAESDMKWSEALDRTAARMAEVHGRLLSHDGDRQEANEFLRDRIEGARSCLIDLQRLTSYGHFRLGNQLLTIRELLSGLGEAHSAKVVTLMLNRRGVDARIVDLSGWRDDSHPDLQARLTDALSDIDFDRELPIVTGYAQCREGLMREFDRGYSEVTFAHIAALTGAREAVIHKEFHLSSADPKIVGTGKARKIGQTDYDVADQMSNLGMEAVHPSAAKILRQAGIPLRVANAFDVEDPGTLILSDVEDAPRVEMVTGLVVAALSVHEPDMVGVKGYDAAILDALTQNDVWIVSKASNANTITHYVDPQLKALRAVERTVEGRFENAEIDIRKIALVSAVGRGLLGLGVPERGLHALAKAGIDSLGVHAIARGVDVQFLVPEDRLNDAITAIHEALVEATSGQGFGNGEV
ncbi:aspartate kinase [Rhodovulum visakhapatnamense]|uniref:aspartate kinase n=1 Tax=Rhodovulum visakhapatnamense TaxID=364297 RepID=A0A4V3GTH7_9RHOB|nr:aspartate kinase [Rhodovulum visakhapatnamense]TDX26863.1 aspartate kinase [Rhodovulum visakhapatnamense]